MSTPTYRHTDALDALGLAEKHIAEVRRILMGAGQPEPPPGYTLSPGDDPAVAMRDLKAGDTLYLADGRHPYPIHIIHEGMTVKAAPGAEPVVWGAVSMPWEPYSGSVYRARYDRFGGRLYHQRSQNANFDPARRAAHNAASAPELIIVPDATMRPAPSLAEISEDQFHYDEKEGWLYVYMATGDRHEDVQVAAWPSLLMAAEGVGGITVEGIGFIAAGNSLKRGAVHVHSDGNTFRNLNVWSCNSIAYSIWGMGTTMESLNSHDAGQMGFHCRIGKSTVTNCGHRGSNRKGYDMGWEAGCKFELSADNVFTNWKAYGSSGPGLWFDIGNHRNEVRGFVLERCTKSALLVEHYAEDNSFTAGIITGTRRWDQTGRGAALQVQSNVKGNTFRDITATGTEDDTAAVVKTTEKRGGSGPNTYDNVQMDGEWRFEGGKHEKDVFTNMEVPA